MNIHLLGVVSLNGGDAAILEAEVAVLRRRWPGAGLVVHDRDPVAAVRYLPVLRFSPPLVEQITSPPGGRSARRLSRLRRQAAQVRCSLAGRWPVLRPLLPRALRGIDLAVYTGGTSLTENYRLLPKLWDLDLMRRAGVPYVFFPQSAGPFEQAANRAALAPVLAGAALVMLRDDRSLQHVLDAGAHPDRCTVVPDVVFALARTGASAPPGPAGRTVDHIAISVREWEHFTTQTPAQGRERTIAAFRHLVTALVRERGARVVFVSTCQGRPEYTHDDSLLAVEIAAALPADVAAHVEVDRSFYGPSALVDRLAGFDALVSMRLHAAILAVCSALPTLTVAYEYKSTEVWGQLGMDDFTVDLETVEGDRLVERTVALLDRREEIRHHLAVRVEGLRRRALDLGEQTAEAVRAASGARRL